MIIKFINPLYYTLIFLVCLFAPNLSYHGIGTLEAKNIQKEDIDNTVTQLLAVKHVKEELIVKFRDEIAAYDVLLQGASTNAHSGTGAVIKRKFRGLKGLQLVKLPGSRPLEDALISYLENPQIEYAEPNYIVHATVTPDDPGFINTWGLHNTGQAGGTTDADIDAPEAWNITTGSNSVVIAVIDSGVAINSIISVGHPDLTANIWTNTGETSCTDGVDNDMNGYIDDCYGWDFENNDNDPMDYALHGTHVSGTIAAVGNNNQGITGVMWNASIMTLRFLDATGSGSTANAISAILYANENGADVINNSWGGGGFSQALKDVIDASSAVVVCAAGNDGRNNDSIPHYPASYASDNIISVAATDRNDSLASFSNYGATSVDIAAPGVSIYSTIPARNELFFDNMTDLQNWNADSPWGISSIYTSYPYSAADSPVGNYANNANGSLELASPLILTNERGTVLEYMLRLQTEHGWDFFWIEASLNGNSWNPIGGWTGSTGSFFYFMEENLTPYDDMGTVYIRFRLNSDHSITFDGAYIDDVSITSYSETYTGSEYTYFQGTSMAAPHVSGVAGLIKSFNPSLTNLEIIDAILLNAEVIGSLSGLVQTGGRLNAYSALNSISCPNLPVRILSTSSEYPSLQAAYIAAGSGDTIMSHAVVFVEDPDFNLNKSVNISGGYDCNYTDNPGYTTLNGTMTVTSGTLVSGKNF
jgi:subtilisin family serine protease